MRSLEGAVGAHGIIGSIEDSQNRNILCNAGLQHVSVGGLLGGYHFRMEFEQIQI